MAAQVLIQTAIETRSDGLDVLVELETTSDGRLLADVATGGSAESFRTLVERHSAKVLAACGRQLGDAHAAEDAAQAVFLVLWQKARSLRRRKSVAGWLHHVARNVCRNARRARHARQRHEQQAAEMTTTAANTHDKWSEVKEFLNDEIDRLQEKYRLPVILFHLQGYSQEEIAAMLNSKPATIATRLRRAREILSSRLARRGVSVAVGGLLAMLTTQASIASPPAAFVTSTTQADTLLSTGHITATAAASAPSVALAKRAISMLTLTRIQTTAIVATVCGQPKVDELTIDHFIDKNKLQLQAAAPGEEAVALLISPILDTGEHWRPTRIQSDEKNIVLTVEACTDNQSRRRRSCPPTRFAYVIPFRRRMRPA